jgi:hypothetical protein
MFGLSWLVRFFRIVPPVPPLIVGLLAVTVSVTALVILFHSARASDALVPVFLLQMFAAASGFMVPARRGYYDLLMTRVGGRLRVLLVHWAASVIPGGASWLALAVVEMVAGASTRTATLSSGSLAAMWLVSCIPWAITSGLPRFAGALIWLITFVASVTLVPEGQAGLVRILRNPQASPASAFAFLVYPVGLVGQHLTPAQMLTVVPGLVFATLCLVGTFVWLHRVDIRLEAAQ